MRASLLAALVGSVLLPGDPCRAEVKVGVVLSLTGPAASAGLLEQRAIPFLPKAAGGEAIRYIVLDDASDTTAAVTDVRKLRTTDDVDVLIASTTTPSSIAASSVAAELEVPQIALAPTSATAAKWTFVTPPPFSTFARLVVDDLVRRDLRKVAFIGYADSLGQAWLDAISAAAKGTTVIIDPVERYNRTDASILAQVLRVTPAKPDAVVVGATSSSAAEPQKALVGRGFRGPVYHTQAAATKEFLREAGGAATTALLPVSLPIVAETLPESNPSRERALAFVRDYEGAYGEGSRNNFASHLWDAGLLLEAAIPSALSRANPGTAAFRAALRDALEGIRGLKVSNGVVTMSADDHYGYDDRSAALARVDGDRFVLSR